MSSNFYDRNVEEALSKEKLDQLKPEPEELYRNTKRARMWYNEAVWTAAALFVEAAKKDDLFRTHFVKDVKAEETIEYDDHENITVEKEVWRETMKNRLPELHSKTMEIGLSAFQGGNAEKVARRYIEREL